MSSLRIGIVGLGNIGRNHARILQESKVTGAHLAAVCDVDPGALAAYPGIRHYTQIPDIIRSGEIDALIIATPHFSHVPIGIAALEQGLHVLVEKPLTVHKADCERLLAAHVDPRQVFAIMFDTRTEPRYIKLRELVHSGELGRIMRINWTLTDWFRSNAYYASSGWRATWAGEGGGILVNQLPHDLDLFQWIFGLPKFVRAFCRNGRHHPIEVEDEVSAYMEFADGASAVLVASTGEAPGVDRREIVGDRGTVLVHPDRLEFRRNTIPTSEYNRTTPNRFGRPDAWDISIPIHGAGGRHATVIQAFVDAIQKGTPLVAHAEEGTASVELANAFIYSSALQKTVELPLDGAVYEKFLQQLIATSRPAGKIENSTAPVLDDMAASFRR